MKPTTLFFSLVSAISTVLFSAVPSFAQTTSVPITGGTLSLGGNISGSGLISAFGNVTAITQYGLVKVDSFNPTSNLIFSIPAIGLDSSKSLSSVTRDIAAGDAFSLLNASANGRISERSFQNAAFNTNGTFDSVSVGANSASASATLNGGSIVLPTTLLNGLPANTGISNSNGLPSDTGISSNPSTIRAFGRLTYDAASGIYTVQPVSSASANALPIGKPVSFVFVSSLATSRIHPGLGR